MIFVAGIRDQCWHGWPHLWPKVWLSKPNFIFSSTFFVSNQIKKIEQSKYLNFSLANKDLIYDFKAVLWPPNKWSCPSQIASFLHFNGNCDAVLGHWYSVDLTRTTLFLSQNSSSALASKHLRCAGACIIKHIAAVIYGFSWMRPGAYRCFTWVGSSLTRTLG